VCPLGRQGWIAGARYEDASLRCHLGGVKSDAPHLAAVAVCPHLKGTGAVGKLWIEDPTEGEDLGQDDGNGASEQLEQHGSN